MRAIITYCFILLMFSLNAQTIKLDYQPKGQIIEFHFDSLIVYTDTSSFFHVYSNKGAETNANKIKSAVLQQFKKSKKDTAVFLNDLVPLDEGKDGKFSKNWSVESTILLLTKEKKSIIIDKHGQIVKTIVTKTTGTKKSGRIVKVYMNKDTKEELLSELLFLRT